MIKHFVDNGWIPCYQRLPTHKQLCLVTVFNTLGDGLFVTIAKFYDGEEVPLFKGEFYQPYFDDGFTEYSIQEDVETNNAVVAWMPCPSPFSVSEGVPPSWNKPPN